MDERQDPDKNYPIKVLDMEDPLKEAAKNGDVEFLRNCVASNKPWDYYLTLFPQQPDKPAEVYGNILHLAAWFNRGEFVREAIVKLPLLEVIQKLLSQTTSEETGSFNPLHSAAANGNLEIVNMFLNVFRTSSASSLSSSKFLQKPWLQKDKFGCTPCFWAIINNYEDCALEILRMDVELLSNMPNNEGESLLCAALGKGFDKISLEILRSSPSFNSAGLNGKNALHLVTNCAEQEGEEICRLLLQKDPNLLEQIDTNGNSILNIWAENGKVWPFECSLACNNIIPGIQRILVTLLSKSDYDKGWNPLHRLATISSTNEEDVVKIAKLLIDTYKHEEALQGSNIPGVLFPWLMEDKLRRSLLTIAIQNSHEKLAMYILSVDNNALIKCRDNALFLAIENGRHEVAELILDIVDKQGWTQLLTNHQRLNALHLAPKCKESGFCKKLLKRHPELLKGVDKQGLTVLHTWANIGEVWPFQYVLNSGEIDRVWRSYFIKLMYVYDYHLQSPLHAAAASTGETKDEIAKLLVEAVKDEIRTWHLAKPISLPWHILNKYQDAPLHIAIRNRRQNFASYILSLCDDMTLIELLDQYQLVHNTLFLAVENNCYQVAKEILGRLKKECWTKYVVNSSDGRNVLHLAPTCTDKQFGTWLVNEAAEFITKPNHNLNTPLDEASSVGSDWIIKAMLQKDCSVFSSAPLAWIKACENGHVSAVRAFIDYNPGKFKDQCIMLKNSPLHHIQLPSLNDYEAFLDLPRMKDLINLQDDKGRTPLHIAIRNGDIFLTEALVNMDRIVYNIKDGDNETAIDLLAQLCDQNQEWDEMCKRNGFDPRIKTTYFQHKTNLLDVRNTLIVVAALLATITFTAGFTLPGGFDQNTGEAMLTKKAAFLIFLISDTLALFLSMLVLVCLIWSMVYDPSKSLLLIDRSMVLLMRSLYCTLLAFMTGVYVVIRPKSLWAAVLVIVIICSLLMISVSKSILYRVIDKLIPAANEDLIDYVRKLELGKVLYFRGSRLKAQKLRESNCLKSVTFFWIHEVHTNRYNLSQASKNPFIGLRDEDGA